MVKCGLVCGHLPPYPNNSENVRTMKNNYAQMRKLGSVGCSQKVDKSDPMPDQGLSSMSQRVAVFREVLRS
ncbi:hypothetical protein D4R75_14590 [bacterium]|nr:MAG: hypothetical protein D4R75_14590 [bacterium]